MVAEHNERVVGFMIYELHKNRLHILNFAVHEQMRRRRIGTQMVRKLASKLSCERRNRLMLEIRETNLSAQLFFRCFPISVRAFYDDTPEDAYSCSSATRRRLEPPGTTGDRMAGYHQSDDLHTIDFRSTMASVCGLAR
jgi:ribosomal-protein-alanine N-acetyltransferase